MDLDADLSSGDDEAVVGSLFGAAALVMHTMDEEEDADSEEDEEAERELTGEVLGRKS